MVLHVVAIVVGSIAALFVAAVLYLLVKNAREPLRASLVTIPLPGPAWRSAFMGHFGAILAAPPGSLQLAWARATGEDLILYFGHLQVGKGCRLSLPGRGTHPHMCTCARVRTSHEVWGEAHAYASVDSALAAGLAKRGRGW
jgi:hypothetical protein